MPQKNCKGQRQNRLFASVDFFDDQNCVPIAHRPSATIVLQSDGFLLPEFGYDNNSAFRPSAAFAHNFTVRDGILSALQTERRCRLLPAVFDIGLQRKFVSPGIQADSVLTIYNILIAARTGRVGTRKIQRGTFARKISCVKKGKCPVISRCPSCTGLSLGTGRARYNPDAGSWT